MYEVSDRVKQGLRVKIKANNELHSGIVEYSSYVSLRLSYDCYILLLYTQQQKPMLGFSVAQPLHGSMKEIQFQDLITQFILHVYLLFCCTFIYSITIILCR